jgi:hypothetical protein
MTKPFLCVAVLVLSLSAAATRSGAVTRTFRQLPPGRTRLGRPYADPVFRKAHDYVTPLVTFRFGAFDCTTASSIYVAFTLGGLQTDVDGRVLGPDGAAIPGLFAAGRCTSGLSVGGYSSGLLLGDGTFFGRRAGASAAAGR